MDLVLILFTFANVNITFSRIKFNSLNQFVPVKEI